MSPRKSVGLCFVVLGLAFVVPTLTLLVFEPRMGFETPADYLVIELVRRGHQSLVWRLSDAAEIVYAVALLLAAGALSGWARASENMLGRAMVLAAAGAAGLFLIVGMIGFAGVPAAEGVGAPDAALSDSGFASLLVTRAAFRAGSVFALGVFLALFVAVSATRRLVHPVLAVLGVAPAAIALVFPWIMLPVPLAFAAWFTLAGLSLLATKDDQPAA